MADLVGPILEFIKFVGRPVTKYLKYQRKFNEYVDGFRQAKADLHDRKGDIHQQLQDEHHLGKKPKQEVESWLRKVDEKLGHAQCVEDKISRGKYLLRSCLGALVDETTQAMKEVRDEGHFLGSLVVNDPSIMAAKLPTPELAGETNVREEICKYLMEDEVSMIGVCGMGGIGKTTIMKHVHNRLLEETKFKKLIWATVSQDFNVRRLQNNIACQLLEDLSDDEDTTIRAAKLSEMLRKQEKYVLILDDVWKSFSLEDVGIIEPNTNNGCKLVLTTRSEEVVRSMGCKKVQVACLSMDEAVQLFLSKVGQDMLLNPTLESVMRLIVSECDGLPLAIVTVAGCMKGVSDPLVWENALNELRGYIRNIQDVEDKVFGCLRFSYDHLKQMDQDCFLYCALYPEDYEIEKGEIIEYWMEEGLIEEMGTRKAMQSNGHSILQKLEENSLLERAREGTHIKMHDVVRDMALHITRKRFLVKACMQLFKLPNEEEWFEGLEKVSFMYNNFSYTIPPSMKFSNYQKLTTLLLSHNRLFEIPESFFEHIPNLKILDLSYTPIKNLPNSISNLEKLTAVLLRSCPNLKSLPSLLKLQALKKLDLDNTRLEEIPQGLETLVNLKYVHLIFSWPLEEIPDGLVSKLCHLQILKIQMASTRAEGIRELNGLEVFEGWFRNVHELSMYVGQRKKLCKYLFLVSQSLANLEIYSHMDYAKMVVFLDFDINSEDAIMLPSDIQQLHVVHCKGLTSLSPFWGLKDATHLKECTICDCDELESIFSSRCHLQTLESLKLKDLKNLKAIIKDSWIGTFSSLRELYLWNCGQIKNLFSAKWVFHNLEDVTVACCNKMEEIIVSSEEEAMVTIKFSLPKLRKLILVNLPELKSICSKNGAMVCDSLQHIHIKLCPKLKRIPLNLPLLELDKKKPPPSPLEICVDSKEWWESVEWDHPNAKNVLLPFLDYNSATTHHGRIRTYVKVYKRGAVGRSIDISAYSDYYGLKQDLARRFGIEGQWEYPGRIGWKPVHVNYDDDVVQLGDYPWKEFVRMVLCIKILSPPEVQEMNLGPFPS